MSDAPEGAHPIRFFGKQAADHPETRQMTLRSLSRRPTCRYKTGFRAKAGCLAAAGSWCPLRPLPAVTLSAPWANLALVNRGPLFLQRGGGEGATHRRVDLYKGPVFLGEYRPFVFSTEASEEREGTTDYTDPEQGAPQRSLAALDVPNQSNKIWISELCGYLVWIRGSLLFSWPRRRGA